MLRPGSLNPHVLDLLARIRHTNTLVIADRGFPFWPKIESVYLSPVDGVLTMLQALEPHISFKQRLPRAIRPIRTDDMILYANLIIESA